ncbi:hypothetical protein ATANTOWER_029781, partial [Ataeniobius toweri]|nr:hypothetical protein [Ataeniobius toweri]
KGQAGRQNPFGKERTKNEIRQERTLDNYSQNVFENLAPSACQRPVYNCSSTGVWHEVDCAAAQQQTGEADELIAGMRAEQSRQTGQNHTMKTSFLRCYVTGSNLKDQDDFSGDFLNKNLIQFTCLEIIENVLASLRSLYGEK